MPRNPVFNDNALKLGVFFANVGGGARPTLAEGRLAATWQAVLEVARLADAGGIEAIIPLATWSVRNTESDFTRYSFEPWTWAAGLAQATEHIAVFATAQVPIFPPVVAAKLAATVDHIANGRFAINVVCGHAGQALDGLVGAPQLSHDEWYAYADEWIEILERLWRAETDVFDFSGRFFQLKGAGSFPKPLQQPRPAIMNAGTSEVGQRWAAKHSDIMFTSAHEKGDAAVKARVDQVRSLAREYGREVSVWMSSSIVCRPTRTGGLGVPRLLRSREGGLASGNVTLARAQPAGAAQGPAERRAQGRVAPAGGRQLLHAGAGGDSRSGRATYAGPVTRRY